MVTIHKRVTIKVQVRRFKSQNGNGETCVTDFLTFLLASAIVHVTLELEPNV